MNHGNRFLRRFAITLVASIGFFATFLSIPQADVLAVESIINTSDISVVVAAPIKVVPYREIRYDITVTNKGPFTASGVQFCSTLSIPHSSVNLVGLEQGIWYLVIGASGPIGRYTDCSVYGELLSLASGSSASMSYTIVEAGPQIISNTVKASALEKDRKTTNNRAVVATFVKR